MTETKAVENYVDWVRDAHAMEEQAEAMLSRMAERLEHYPELKSRILQHIEETKEQQHLVKTVLDRLDTSRSVLKDAAGKISAMGQAMGGMFASDEVVKGAISGYVFEQLEIASYTALIAAAQVVGDDEGVQTFTRIRSQEQEMAQWLSEHLPEVTQAFLQRADDPDSEAKR